MHRVLMSALLSSAAVLAAVPAYAQAQNAPTPPASAQGAGSGIADIVVTAQRRSESLQRVPVSVNALTSDSLKTKQINDLTQLTLVAPSLQTGVGGFAVRGIGTITTDPSIEGSVAIAIDDVSIGEPGQVVDTFNDVARVEVLNGPQGLLFGRNSSAGLINIITNKPVMGRISDEFSLEAGASDRPNQSSGLYTILRDALNIPIGDKSALRINGLYSYNPLVGDDVTTSSADHRDADKSYGLRLKFLTNPTDRLSVYLIGEVLKDESASITSVRSVGTGKSFIAPYLAADGITPGPNNVVSDTDSPNFLNKRQVGVQGTVSYDLGGGWTLSNIAAWKRFDRFSNEDADEVSVDILDTRLHRQEFNQYSDELRLSLPANNRLSGQTGFYYFHGDLSDFQQTSGGFAVAPAAQHTTPYCVTPTTSAACKVSNAAVLGEDYGGTLTNDSYAGFGQLTYRLLDNLSLIAGGRVTHDELHITDIQDQQNYARLLLPRVQLDQSTSDTNFSWKVGAQYQFTSQVMAYLTYGAGYKGPGANLTAATSAADLLVKPETSKALEIGVKSSWFERRLLVDISLFHTVFDDFQVQSYNPEVTAFTIQNAAQVTTQGGEFTIIGKPLEGLTLSVTGAYVDSRFDEFPGAQCYFGQTNAGCSTTSTFNAANYKTPASPTFTSTIEGRYEHPLSATVLGFVDANLYSRSSINYNVNAAPGATVGPMNILGASIGADFGNLRVSLFCKNCTNKIFPTYIVPDPIDATVKVNSFDQQFGANSVRSVGLNLNYKY